jgi:hypothetical protein
MNKEEKKRIIRQLKETPSQPDLKKEVVNALDEFELPNKNTLITEIYLLKEKTKDSETKRILTEFDVPNRLAVIHSILLNINKKLK